jgi:hypothetical protein
MVANRVLPPLSSGLILSFKLYSVKFYFCILKLPARTESPARKNLFWRGTIRAGLEIRN